MPIPHSCLPLLTGLCQSDDDDADDDGDCQCPNNLILVDRVIDENRARDSIVGDFWVLAGSLVELPGH